MEALRSNEWLFVGLGNPGTKYAMTRHNIGYMTIHALAQRLGARLKEEARFKGLVGKGVSDGSTIHFLLPTTYMNLSGEAVRKYIDYHKLDPQKQMVVVMDDADLPYRAIRLREQGGSGGHNGLKSIDAILKTQEYPRLRMGIGRGPQEGSLADYVLNNFSEEEMAVLPEFIHAGVTCLLRVTQGEMAQVMNAVNKNQKLDLGKG